ncbi:MAG: glycosyltransferase [Chthoniobacteraceae bacterium]
MPDLPVAYHLAVTAVLVLGLITVLVNLAFFDGLTPAPPPACEVARRVSILVPARNEERCIGPCIASLLAQDYPNFELIVLDDQSSDATPHLLDELGVRPGDPLRRLIRGQPLPSGWVGKNWACDQLASAATGEFLFFTDADTTHAPGTVSAAVAYSERRRASLVSAWPRLVTVTWSEKLIIPMILLLGMTHYPHWLVLALQRWPNAARRLPRSLLGGLGAGNGQFMFWRRSAYDAVGGHAALRAHLVEDVALGRAVAARIAEGLRLFNCDALRFSTCRMYRSFGETWSGFTKNLWPAFEGRVSLFCFIGAVQVFAYLAPSILLCLKWHSSERPWLAAQVGLILAIRIVLTARYRTSWLSCLFHPLAELIGIAIALNSWRLASRRGVVWKGRRYTTATPS